MMFSFKRSGKGGKINFLATTINLTLVLDDEPLRAKEIEEEFRTHIVEAVNGFNEKRREKKKG